MLDSAKLNANILQKRAKLLEKILYCERYTGLKKIVLQIIVKRIETDKIDQEIKDLF